MRPLWRIFYRDILLLLDKGVFKVAADDQYPASINVGMLQIG